MASKFEGLLLEQKCFLLNDLLLILGVSSNYNPIQKFVSQALKNAADFSAFLDFNTFFAILKLHKSFEKAINERVIDDFENFYFLKHSLPVMAESLSKRMSLYQNQLTVKNINLLTMIISEMNDKTLTDKLAKLLQAVIITIEKHDLQHLWSQFVHRLAFSVAQDQGHLALKSTLELFGEKVNWKRHEEFELRRNPGIIELAKPL